MKQLLLFMTLLITAGMACSSQKNISSPTSSLYEQDIINISREKWQWMADKNVDKLASLFHDKSKFVHMSGTWKKIEELDIIKTGRIWYKKTDVHDVAVEIVEYCHPLEPDYVDGCGSGQ